MLYLYCNNNNPFNKENHARHVNKTRNTVFTFGDSLNKKMQNKKLIKVRLFSVAKVTCMYDHVKPTIREFNPNHIILHVGTNELKNSKS